MGTHRDALNLYSFFKYGNIGDICTGMPVERLWKHIDRRRLSKKYHHAEWSYSYFYRYHIELIIIEEHLDVIVLNMNLINPAIDFFVGDEKQKTTIDRNITLETLPAGLEKYNIGWGFEQRYCFNRQLAVKTEGGVSVMFDFRDGWPPLGRMIKGNGENKMTDGAV